MLIRPGFATDPGTREEQQDSFSLTRYDDKRLVADFGVMAVVTDGMGGIAGGQQASHYAAQAMRKAYEAKNLKESIPDALLHALGQANKSVLEKGSRMNVDGIGTTLVSAVVHEGHLYWISAGDSRAYLLRGGELTRLTCDHNRAMELLEEVGAGNTDLQDARDDPEREGLISFLGQPKIGQVDRNVRSFPLRVDDRVLLCTDGLYRTVPEHTIARLLDNPDPQSSADQLVRAALDERLPHQDNVTVAVLAAVPSPIEAAEKFLPLFDRRLFIQAGGAALVVLVAVAAVKYFPKIRTLVPSFGHPADIPPRSAQNPSSDSTPTRQEPPSQPTNQTAATPPPEKVDDPPTPANANPNCAAGGVEEPPVISSEKAKALKASAESFLQGYYTALATGNVEAVRPLWVWFDPKLEAKIRDTESASLRTLDEGPVLFRGDSNTLCARIKVLVIMKKRSENHQSVLGVTNYLKRVGETWKMAAADWD